MPPTGTDEGIQVAQALRQSHPTVGVVVLSQYVAPSYALGLFETGSHGRAYVLKEGIHKVVDALVEARRQKEDSRLVELTNGEIEIVAEIAQAKSNAAIAESLFLTKRAVEKHINSIFLKLDLRDSEDVSRRVTAALMFLAESES